MSAQTTLDEIWLKESGQDKDFFGGLIQCSVAMYHLTNDNPKGAGKIYEKAKGMLSAYGEIYLDMNLGRLLADLDTVFSDLNSGKSNLDYLKQSPKIELKE